MTTMFRTDPVPATEPNPSLGIALSVIVPVFDQADMIAANVESIRDRVAAGMSDPFEIIVVSDGSVDGTAERVIEQNLADVRVLYYDRNLGKGYAVKTGAREARGRWVGYVDADLDLDPAALPGYMDTAEREGLDFAIGSKRHPDSNVVYPSSRVVASWMYQQVVRMLFRLDVRDTQVGLKVFRREVAKEVMPLLLVKRYAFDVELLAVSRAFGYGRVKEMPISLDYRFTGSGVRSMAVLHALIDTAAVFYRLRILGFYRRRQASIGHFPSSPPDLVPSVTLLEVSPDATARRLAAESAEGDILAFLEVGAHQSANWITSTLPFFARNEVAAVVTPQLSPSGGNRRERGAAAIAESRLGSGSLGYRFKPGSIRFTTDFPARSFLVRRDRFLALDPATPPEEVVLGLNAVGGRTLYLPEASVTIPAAALFRAHLSRIGRYGLSRGIGVRRRGISTIRISTVAAVGLLGWALLGWILIVAGEETTWVVVWSAYLGVVCFAALFGGLRFRSVRVGGLTAVGLVLTHFAYVIAFMLGLARPRRL
jgi:glycosyltransferase involved in cell wall biosynthesis